MTSTGCDIVALKAIDAARTKQQNFYSKIITPAEKGLYDSCFTDSIPLEVFAWLAWSVKESAYKFLQRLTPGFTFSPSKIILKQVTPPSLSPPILPPELQQIGFDNQSVYQGIANSGDQALHFRSLITHDFIFSVVNIFDDFEDTYWGIKYIDTKEPAGQSESVREFILEKLDSLFPGGNLVVQKSAHGYPVILQNDIKVPVAVSFTHHDHWVAYSFVTTE